ncbi:MAG: DNA polymerase IV [Gammaproteobacteria bacterium]|nr:DNA polymerase IV [Gammaproteobacteria bacterium]
MIIHIDMDAFYASVEEKDQPELKGRPVIVGGSPRGRGVVSAANYIARQFGVHSAMPMSRAVRICPQAVCISPRMSRYVEVSHQIHEIFSRYTPEIEPLSLDEAFLDVAGSRRLYGSPEQIGQRIKQEIQTELGLVASVGIAASKFIAKIASDIDKPDGFKVVAADESQVFLDPLPVSRLWGVGKATHQVFERLGVQTIKQVRQLPEAVMVDHFGKHGTHLWRLAQGIDDRSVVTERQAKSISNETTFAHDIHDTNALHSVLMELTEQVAGRLRHAGLRGRTVNFKLRFADFKTLSRSFTLEKPTQTTEVLWQTANRLFEQCNLVQSVRLIGMGVSNLVGEEDIVEEQTDLFATIDPRQEQLDELADSINNRFGKKALHRASSTKRSN